MELIKLVDYEEIPHYLNKDYIISIRPFSPIDERPINTSIEYGNGWTDCIYMQESVNEVVGMIEGTYYK